MPVTIQIIETKEFALKPNGYDPQEVDNFLDEIVDELERIQNENKKLRQSPPPPQQQATNRASASSSDETIRAMLANAQRVCDDTVNDARKRSDDMLREAKREADKITLDAREEERRLSDRIVKMREAADGYRIKFQKLVDDQMSLFEDER